MSRKLNREEFLPLLKEFSDKLDANNIRNEIPFMYKNKGELDADFDYIKLIIPQETDITILEDIFKTNDYQKTGRFIDFYYKDFRFVIILTPENDFIPTFFYYSWDIVPTLMNVMLNKMGMNLEPSGLKYVAVEKPFNISNNIQYIIEYLDLDFNLYMKKGFKSLFDEISFITTSQYFNTQIFRDYNLNENDFFYFDKKHQYKYALSLLSSFDEMQFQGYDYNKELDSYLLNIDLMFPGVNFLENVVKFKCKK